jgi:hypothetical protein
MSFYSAIFLVIFIFLLAFVASKLIRKMTGRAGQLDKKGYLIVIIGLPITLWVGVYYFHMAGPASPIYCGAIAGFWALVAQAFAGKKVGPPK